MEQIFMGVVTLYFLVKGIWFILIKFDKLDSYIDDWEWDEQE